MLEVVFKPVRIGSDSQRPLLQRYSLYRVVTPLTQSIDHFFVGQHSSQRRAPVHQRIGLIRQAEFFLIIGNRTLTLSLNLRRNRQLANRAAFFRLGIEPGIEQHQENPLRPTEVLNVCRRQLAIPIVAEAEHFQLTTKVADIAFGRFTRGRIGFDSMFFSRQTERIETHWMQDRLASSSAVATNDIGGRVAFGVSNMQTIPAGVRKHVQNVNFLALDCIWSLERLVLVPVSLPTRLYFGWVVLRHKYPRFPNFRLLLRSGQSIKSALTWAYRLPWIFRLLDSK